MTDTRARKTRFDLEGMERRDVPAGFVVSAAQPGAAAVVRVLDGTTGAVLRQIDAFPGYTGGLFADAGRDRNGDGLPDRVAVGTRGGTTPHVEVFDGATGALVQSFFAYDPGFLGGVDVALGDVNRDGTDDVMTGAAAGTSPHVKVFDGRTGATAQSFLAFDAGFRGGVNVDDADVNGDGFDDVLVGAAVGAAPHVKAFDGRSAATLRSFLAFDGAFVGGVRVAGGDLDGNGRDDIVVGAGPGAGSHVKVFRSDDLGLISSRLVFEDSYRDGVELNVSDASGNGLDDLIVERRGGGNRFRAFDDRGVDGPFHDLFDDGNRSGTGGSGSNGSGSGSGGGSGAVARKIEGTVAAVNASARQVVIRRASGDVTVTAGPNTEIERNDAHTTLAAFRVGDRGEVEFAADGTALKIEATGA